MQGKGDRENFAAAYEVAQIIAKRAALRVTFVHGAQHRFGTAVMKNHLARTVVDRDAEGKILHDALVERFDPGKLIGVTVEALHHFLEGLGELANLIAAVGVESAQLFCFAWGGADADAQRTQLTNGSRNVVGNHHACLHDDDEHGNHGQNEVALFFDECGGQRRLIE